MDVKIPSGEAEGSRRFELVAMIEDYLSWGE
jgi:hypothetical protein